MDNIEDVKRECERYRLLYENADKSLAYWEEKCRRLEAKVQILEREIHG